MTGRVIGNYRIVDKVGEGGMGTVYRAVDVMLDREVAMKALKPEIAQQPDTLERFRSEARTLARLNHPAIAQLYSFFKDGDDFYMVMEFVPGRTLEDMIQQRGALPWSQACAITVQVLEGIARAHQLGILHRDIKPANIMLTPEGNVKITDFGIAQALGGSKITREGRIVGTIEYLAPERIQGRTADGRCDIYSTGVVLYEMLTGRLPFQSDSEYELLLAHAQRQVPPPRDLGVTLPVLVEQALMQALEKSPDRRYPDADGFATRLRALIPPGATTLGAPIKATRLAEEPQQPPKQTARRRQIALASVCVVGFTAVMFATSVLLKPNLKSPQAAPPHVAEVAAAPATAGGFPPSEPVPPPPSFTPVQPVSEPPAPKPEPPKPKQRVATPQAEQPPDTRRPALAALEQTTGPIRLAPLTAALRAGGAGMSEELLEPIARRGVDFPLNPGNRKQLMEAGANDKLLTIVEFGYRGAETPPAAAPVLPTAPPPAQVPEPVRTTRVVRNLSDVKSIYVAKADSDLDTYIRAELRSQLGGRVLVTDNDSAADAILHLQVQEKKGKLGAPARVFGLKDNTHVEAKLIERVGKKVLWQDDAGDKHVALSGDGLKKLASRLIKELRSKM